MCLYTGFKTELQIRTSEHFLMLVYSDRTLVLCQLFYELKQANKTHNP